MSLTVLYDPVICEIEYLHPWLFFPEEYEAPEDYIQEQIAGIGLIEYLVEFVPDWNLQALHVSQVRSCQGCLLRGFFC